MAILSSVLDGAITSWNPATEHLFGLTAEQAIGQHVSIIVPADSAEELATIMGRIERGSLSERLSTVRSTADGTELHVLLTFSPLYGIDGEVVGASTVARDMTPEATVASELERARDLAIQAAQQQGQFLANMSHEIRTPMTGIIGMSGLLLESDLDIEQRYLAEIVSSSATALLAVLDDILDFSKLDARMMRIDRAPFDVREVVREAIALMSARAAESHLNLECHIDPKLPELLLGDAGRLRQILLNLTGNAVKFTSRGAVTVTVDFEDLQSESAMMVNITVRDTGIGISQESLRGLFEPFTQASSSTSRCYGGTGLGLVIVRQLVELMDGKISVVSELDRGTSITVSIPLAIGAYETPTTTASIDAPGSPQLRHVDTPVRESKFREVHLILLAEDNSVNRQVTARYLTKLGYDFDIAVNGDDALDKLNSHHFDAVLMDCHMPDVDGFAATRELRRREGSVSRTPVIALTASALEEDKRRCMESGMDDIVLKPIRLASLEAALSRWTGAAADIHPLAPLTEVHHAAESGPPGPSSPLINDAILDELLAITGSSIMSEILANYEEELRTALPALTQLVASGERITEVKDLAHSLAGSSANIGAERLAKAASAMERLVSSRNLRLAFDLLCIVDEAAVGTLAVLDQHLQALR